MNITKASPVLFASLLAAQGASAALVFSSSAGSRSASAEFDIVDGKLQVKLTNTSTGDVTVPTDVLTGLFFTLNGNQTPTLTRNSAVIATGSQVIYSGGQPAGGNVGGEWAYKAQSGLLGGQFNQGISSSGMDDTFGPPHLFPGSNLAGPESPNGLQYGLTSAGDNPATGNGGVTGSGGLIKNSVVFTLGNLPAGFTLDDIGSVVRFQYGTSLSEPSLLAERPLTPVPEPTTYIAGCLLGIPALLHLARFAKRARARA